MTGYPGSPRIVFVVALALCCHAEVRSSVWTWSGVSRAVFSLVIYIFFLLQSLHARLWGLCDLVLGSIGAHWVVTQSPRGQVVCGLSLPVDGHVGSGTGAKPG